MSFTSLVAVALKITGVLGPRTSENCVSENSKDYFANKQAESRARITRNPAFQKTTAVDLKIMYTKMNANKIHEMQNVKYLQNQHFSVYETEQ